MYFGGIMGSIFFGAKFQPYGEFRSGISNFKNKITKSDRPEYIYDYLGKFSFDNEAIGANPFNWEVTKTNRSYLEVQSLKGTHSKVVYFGIDNGMYGDYCVMVNNLTTPQTSGSLEFWAYVHEIPKWSGGSDPPAFHISGVGSFTPITGLGFLFAFHEEGNKIRYGVGHSPTWYDTGATWTIDRWQHYRIVFNCSTSTYELYQDGKLIGGNLPFRYAQSSIIAIQFGYGWTMGSNMDGKVWIDAIDYSWAPGYYLNRNMDYIAWKTSTKIISTESTANSYDPEIAIDNLGNIHIVWSDWTDYIGVDTDSNIFYKCWNITSKSWTKTEVISLESNQNSYEPSISVDKSGNVHIVWFECTNQYGVFTDFKICYRRWNKTKNFWTPMEIISTESINSSRGPTIAVDNTGQVHIAWYDSTDYNGSGLDYDIFYKRYDPNTGNWTLTEVISTESTCSSFHPTMAVDNAGQVHIAWYDWTDYNGAGTDYDIFYKYRNIINGTWTLTQVISTESTGSSLYPSIAAYKAAHVHIVWHDTTNFNGAGTDSDIFYKIALETHDISSTSNGNILIFLVASILGIVGSIGISFAVYWRYRTPAPTAPTPEPRPIRNIQNQVQEMTRTVPQTRLCICPFCGTKCEKADIFCKRCGAAL